jgi:hypothetical protein
LVVAFIFPFKKISFVNLWIIVISFIALFWFCINRSDSNEALKKKNSFLKYLPLNIYEMQYQEYSRGLT